MSVRDGKCRITSLLWRDRLGLPGERSSGRRSAEVKQSDGVTVTGRKQREAVEMRMEGDGEGDKAFRVAVCNESEA